MALNALDTLNPKYTIELYMREASNPRHMLDICMEESYRERTGRSCMEVEQHIPLCRMEQVGSVIIEYIWTDHSMVSEGKADRETSDTRSRRALRRALPRS